ncbi:hypothetical protein [Rhodopirellula sp. SWK7]|uniref:hypothetical protein n=1 Tax=Rhodopirellula sp. SWK7 TaxID=595460 RepID=UPI0002C03C3D|nr:hypothetical protein [Rhodopirellula sp. SWK7]EMI41266.1 secreted protein [Rhodopirellula sp. SWK7]
MRRFVVFLFLFAIAIPFAEADETETADELRAAIEAEIEAEKLAFDNAMKSIRADVVVLLEKKAKIAISRGDIQAADAANEELRNFRLHDQKPTLVSTRVFERARERGYLRLIRMHEAASRRFVKAGLLEDARILEDLTEELRIQKREPPLKGMLGDQLLANPGCEEPMTKRGVPGWTAIEGQWKRLVDNPRPKTGEGCFSSLRRSNKLIQDVDVDDFGIYIDASSIQFTLKGEMFRGQWEDLGVLSVGFLDDRGQLINTASSRGSSKYPRWQPLSVEGPVPAKTRTMRVMINSFVVKGGKGGMANVYFDDLDLRLSSNK